MVCSPVIKNRKVMMICFIFCFKFLVVSYPPPFPGERELGFRFNYSTLFPFCRFISKYYLLKALPLGKGWDGIFILKSLYHLPWHTTMLARRNGLSMPFLFVLQFVLRQYLPFSFFVLLLTYCHDK